VDLSQYKDLSKSPLSMAGGGSGGNALDDAQSGASSVFSTSLVGAAQPATTQQNNTVQNNSNVMSNNNMGTNTTMNGYETSTPHARQQQAMSNLNDRHSLPQMSAESYQELTPQADNEFSPNVRTLIRLMSELPEGVTKQTGAQIIRLTMEAMGISMEDVLSEAQASQSDMLDAVRANIKKIEEYKTVIRKLETDIKFYQGKANDLSEIIDLFILSNGSSSNRLGQLETMPQHS
jgi:hypothetical protein